MLHKEHKGFYTGVGPGAVSIKVTGLKELHDALQYLPEEVRTKCISEALKAGGKYPMMVAKALIRSRSHALANSIVMKKNRKDEFLTVDLGSMEKTATSSKGKKFKPFYAHMIEWGTKSHPIPKGYVEGYTGKEGITLRDKEKNALYIEGSGHPFYGFIHPGFPAQRPFTRAADSTRMDFIKGFTGYVDKFMDKHFKKWLKQNYGTSGNIHG